MTRGCIHLAWLFVGVDEVDNKCVVVLMAQLGFHHLLVLSANQVVAIAVFQRIHTFTLLPLSAVLVID